MSSLIKWYKKNPWMQAHRAAKARCCQIKNNRYKWYGALGIEFHLKPSETKELWVRDKAHLLNKPSIDRKNNKGHYTFENCQFIEMVENSVKDKRKTIIQYDLNSNFIKEWLSAMEAERQLGISHQNISCAIRGKNGYSQAGCFIWRFKEDN